MSADVHLEHTEQSHGERERRHGGWRAQVPNRHGGTIVNLIDVEIRQTDAITYAQGVRIEAIRCLRTSTVDRIVDIGPSQDSHSSSGVDGRLRVSEVRYKLMTKRPHVDSPKN